MSPFPLVIESSALFGHGGFLVEECFEYLTEAVQTQRPPPCLIERGDTVSFNASA